MGAILPGPGGLRGAEQRIEVIAEGIVAKCDGRFDCESIETVNSAAG
jgi:hypothetical protein